MPSGVSVNFGFLRQWRERSHEGAFHQKTY
jgi:hypothetical protein